MNAQPSPAIVTQDAVRRLPRWALVLLCAAYVIPGFIGRNPWRNADIASLGYMLELTQTRHWQSWLTPTLMGISPSSSALLPYWLGGWAIELGSGWLLPELAVRIPFTLMLIGTLAATWQAVYALAQHPSAQPVVFAFGGEANSKDYAHALADASLLALVATLGLAQFSHETAPAAAQLFFTSLLFFGLANLPFKPLTASVGVSLGGLGLTLSGAPLIALVYLAWAWMALITPGRPAHVPRVIGISVTVLSLTLLSSITLSWQLNLLRWPSSPWRLQWDQWRSLGQLFVWFTWPIWPMVLWALWRWRHHLLRLRQQRHLGLPLMIALPPMISATVTLAGDRALLLALPALAALAAFALPTFKRSAASLIDWFTVLFFTGWAVAIWVVWVAMQTGVPAKPAANVAKLAPGFDPILQWPALIAAVLGTAAWFALARWRTGQHRTVLWKSLVLPAAGTTLCWLLLMTLWLPALDYGRSMVPEIQPMRQIIGSTACVEVHGLTAAQVAALRYHGGWYTVPAKFLAQCDWLVTDKDAQFSLPVAVDMRQWQLVAQIQRPTDRHQVLMIFQLAVNHLR